MGIAATSVEGSERAERRSRMERSEVRTAISNAQKTIRLLGRRANYRGRQAAASVRSISVLARAANCFAGRENERRAIRAVIDSRAWRHGVVVMLGRTRSGKSRLAMEMSEYASRVGSEFWWVTATSETNRFLISRSSRSLKSGLANAPSLDDFRRRMGCAPEFAQIAPSLRRVFRIFRNRWTAAGAVRPLSFQASQRTGAPTQALYVYVSRPANGDESSRRGDSSDQSHRQPSGRIIGTYRDGYSEHMTRGQNSRRIDSPGYPSVSSAVYPKDDIAQMLHGLSQRAAGKSVSAILKSQEIHFSSRSVSASDRRRKVSIRPPNSAPRITIDETMFRKTCAWIIGGGWSGSTK